MTTETPRIRASARSNAPFGYKAVAVYRDGHTYQPARKNFKTRKEALAYAQAWIDANESRPESVRGEKVMICGD